MSSNQQEIIEVVSIIDFMPRNWEKTLEERLGKHRNTIRNILREERIDEYSAETIAATWTIACELILEASNQGIDFVNNKIKEKSLIIK